MKKGSIVVCLFSHSPCDFHTELLVNCGYIFPEVNKFYTIRDFSISYDGILLNEIINPIYEPSGLEITFHLDYFKLIIIKRIIKKSYLCTF